MVSIVDLFLKILIAYFLGSLLGSLIIGKLKGGVDIRQQGSGNAGGTNALRTQGWQFALWVMMIDIGKGWLAVFIATLQLPGIVQPINEWTAVACAMAVIAGHVFPVWFGFRGGKGAATLVGVVAGLAPTVLPYALGVWLLVLMVFGFVGLATMLSMLSLNFWIVYFHVMPQFRLLVFSTAMTVFVIYTHRTNIARMRVGKENRANRLWLFRPRNPKTTS